ncbi:type III-A CRISPR-associated protein Cas10/Csm1 [Candidatus Absconditicoccus praedator]|uniref:type III-A CRISPR-associated protein Cas10/Csm1 n=1 Tax=Candidatus Absconditicoccus praedator TaxID=2735562 RepID=UPI001E6078F8|nr:type III-A CRISPR-associated protein Cas10/Csm1 [Candidatus Absconditicoccus praedator]UFX83258.1 type III-A CRISPR-associated protein Cas10/Csm1 [Candidatus Absconditicoccus praedator]
MQNNKNLYKIIIASYLHDIGKLMWRGGKNRSMNPKGFNKYQIAHAQQALEFMKDNDLGVFWENIGLIASLHHARDFINYDFDDEETQKMAWVVYMADNISSNERVNRIDENDNSYYENIKHIGLTNIFENLFVSQNTSKFTYIPKSLNDLQDVKDFFPTDKGANFEDDFLKSTMKDIGNYDVQNGFKELSNNFQNDLKTLIQESNLNDDSSLSDFRKFIYQLDILCQNYFTLVPSDTYKSIGDISLYDHTKTVVAIANVLYQSNYHNNVYKYQKDSTDTDKVFDEKISLIAGDFPSIQKYIFEGIKNSKAISKRLRARSFNIQMLNEAVIQYILERYELSPANVLINAGGKFVILAPNNIDVADIQNHINSYFVKHYHSFIKINLIQENIKLKNIFQLGDNQIKNTFKSLFDKLSQNKHKIYSKDNIQNLFVEQSIEGKEICAYCRIKYADKERHDEAICETCEKEIQIGEKLVKNDSIYLSYKNGENFEYDIDFENGDLKVLFNNWNYKDLNSDLGISKSINLYVPKNEDDEVKTFEELASKNNKYLNMLCGDIDNMSIILAKGFGDNYSVSRLLQFSRFLELFFGNFSQKILEKEFPNVYTVFSGGDDFVFVLPFEKRIEFINKYQEYFQKFTAANHNLHFSLGLSIFKDKKPFQTVNQHTEELLKSAKNKYKLQMDSRGDLDFRGICIYEQNLAQIDKKILDMESILDMQDWTRGDELTMGESSFYKLYIHLKEIRQYLYDYLDKDEKDKLYQIVHLGAKIIYMMGRNISAKNEEEKRQKNDLIDKVKNLIGTISLKERDSLYDKIDDIDSLLLKFTNHIYQNREK